MAIYRCEARIVKRSAGRSATGAAAYRAAMAIEDERTGLTHDYERRGGVLHSEIMAPENTPAWMFDRASLWNAVEVAENRKDAQLAREFILALPHELTTSENVALLRGFVQREFVARGMIADVNMHGPDRAAPDERNVHAHVMLTTRTLTGEGFGSKAREWNDKALLQHWREEWARDVNRALERGGHEARVDHRSLAAQGIDREPQPKLGPVATQMEREGRDSNAGEDVRAVQARNEARDALRREAAVIDLELARLQRQGRTVETAQGAKVIAALDAIDRHDQRQVERQSAAATVQQAQRHHRRLERREAFAAKKDAELGQRFEMVFRDGGKARQRFAAIAERESWRKAVWSLRTRTKDIGTLKGWGFLAYRSGSRRRAEQEFWSLVKEAGRTEGLKAKVQAEAPERATARAWLDEAQRRQAEEHSRPDPARRDLQLALAEAAKGMSHADYGALSGQERFTLKDAREVAKAARLEQEGQEMTAQPGRGRATGQPTQGQKEAAWEAERKAAIPAHKRDQPPERKPEPERKPDAPERTPDSELPYTLPHRPPPSDIKNLPADQFAKAVQAQQAEDAARAPQEPPQQQERPGRPDDAREAERPSQAFQKAAGQGISDEARQRLAEKAAQYDREMTEERERNRQLGRDLGRTR